MNNKIYRTEDAVDRVRAEKARADAALASEHWQKTAEPDVVNLTKPSNTRYWRHYPDDRPYVAELLVLVPAASIYHKDTYRRELFITGNANRLALKLCGVAGDEKTRLVAVRRATKAETLVLKAFDTERTVEFVNEALTSGK